MRLTRFDFQACSLNHSDISPLENQRFARGQTEIIAHQLELGNVSNVKGVGAGVFEYRIDFGPGYRVYVGKDGDAVVILLCGGTKKRQDRDIARARERWVDYKRRKAEEK